MSESTQPSAAARLRRLPRDLLLALVNATALLLIVAAILALVTITRINNFVANVVATTAEAVLAKIDLPSKGVLANLKSLTEEVRTLGNTLREFKDRENSVLKPEIAKLREELNELRVSIDRLTNARTSLSDEAFARLARSVGDTLTTTLTTMRGCTPNVSQIPSDNTYDKMQIKAPE